MWGEFASPTKINNMFSAQGSQSVVQVLTKYRTPYLSGLPCNRLPDYNCEGKGCHGFSKAGLRVRGHGVSWHQPTYSCYAWNPIGKARPARLRHLSWTPCKNASAPGRMASRIEIGNLQPREHKRAVTVFPRHYHLVDRLWTRTVGSLVSSH